MGFARGILNLSTFHTLVTSFTLDIPQSLQQNESVIVIQKNVSNALEFPSSNSSSNSTQITTDSEVAATNDLTIRCNGAQYGYELRRDSCIDAIDRTDLANYQQSFGQRGTGTFDINLPYRMQSGHYFISWTLIYIDVLIRATGDGTCIIDVIKGRSVPSARASATDVRVAANRVIAECVRDGHGVGGSATGIGKLLPPACSGAGGANVLYVGVDAKIGIVVQAYQPRVECLVLVPYGGDRKACAIILQTMNASMPTVTFGPKGAPGVATSVPMMYRAGSQSMSPSHFTKKAQLFPLR